MFFPLSKIFWGLFAPSHILLWCSLLAVALLLTRRYRRAGTGFAVATAALLIGIGVVPSYTWIVRPLEHRFDQTHYPAHVDGILILGGGTEDVYRLNTAFRVSRAYPEARLVYSGGDGSLIDNQPDLEAEKAKRFLISFGLDPRRLTVEGRSRNTFENFKFTKAQIKPRPNEVWMLVTSGYHLPRAMAIAKTMGWPMIPVPANHLTYRVGTYGYFSIPENLRDFDMTLRELIGLAVYRLTGRSAGR